MTSSRIIHKLSIIILFALYSCLGQKQTDCIKVNLSREESHWFTNFKNGDTLYFSSQQKEIDTFIIHSTDILSYTSCNRFELGPYVYQIGGFSFRNVDNYQLDKYRKRYSIGFSKVGQDSTDHNCKKNLSFFDLRTTEFFDFSRVPKQEFTNPKTGQKIEVYVYTKNYNCSNVEGGIEIMQEFAISKEYGLIWYKTLKGDTYNRVW